MKRVRKAKKQGRNLRKPPKLADPLVSCGHGQLRRKHNGRRIQTRRPAWLPQPKEVKSCSSRVATKGLGTIPLAFCGLQLGRPIAETSNSEKQFFIQTTDSRTIWPAWHLPALHLDDFDSFLSQALREIGRRPPVCNQTLNAVEGT